jgi:hypothetical protein
MRGAHLAALYACGFVLVVLALVSHARGVDVADAQQAPATCTQIVGFSQTMQWYFAGFQSSVGNPRNWELRWVGGGSIGNWADPNYEGWVNDNNQVDGCAQSSSTPDRALLNISDDFHSDISYWVTQTTAAMNNLRNKYPSVRTIILQPVVGGPGGSQCTFNGSVVRASYNFPYINQAIAQMASSTVVAGFAPTVRSCADYADDLGHLTDDAKGPIGITIGGYYASASTGNPTNTPTNTPTAGPTATPVPTLSTGQTRTITFDDLSSPNRTLSGQYPAGVIDWGTNNWYLSAPFGSFRTNSLGFNGPAPTSETFSFITPMRLIQVDAYNGDTGPSTITLSCNSTRATQVVVQASQTQTVPMGWIGICNTVTFASSNGWKTNFDNLVVDNGQTTATNTPTSTPVTQATTTPTPTPVAVSQSGTVTVTFDDLSNANRTLNGQYPTGFIDWGTNNWYLSGPYGSFRTNSVGFNGAGPTSETFTLVSPRRLAGLDAYNGGSTTSTLSLACPGQATRQVALAPRQLLNVSSNWTATCTSITLSSTNGWNTNFDNLVFDSGTSTSGAVTFDDLTNTNRPLNGQYPGGVIDWGTNVWFLSGPYGAFRTNSVGFNGNGPLSASFSLVSPKRLVQLDAYNGGPTASTITLSCAGQPTVSVSLASHAQQTIQTGWTGTCASVTLGSSNGWDTNFDNLVLQ